MKLNPIPTSPKVRDKSKLIKEISSPSRKFDTPKKNKNGLAVLLVAILFGFLAGFLGEITLSSLAVRYPNSPVLDTLYLRMNSTPGELIIRKEAESITARELQTHSMITNSSKLVVSIFAKKKKNQVAGLEAAYADSQKLGNGVFVTNDGLIMTTTNVVSDSQADYVIILPDGSVFEPDNIIIDQPSHTSFFWVDSSSNYVADFELEADIPLASDNYILMNSTAGQVQVRESGTEELSSISSSESPSIIESSDEFSRFIRMSKSFESAWEGAPVVRNNGKIIGLVFSEDYPDSTNIVLPHNYATDKLAQFISEKEAVRPKLGIHYVDLSKAVGLSSDMTSGEKEGILIIGDLVNNIPAIEAKSPAIDKLKEGDIITNINDQAVLSDAYFTELIQLLEPGEKINLEVIRDGIKKVITVTPGKIAP